MRQRQIGTWAQFVDEVGPFLFAPDPVHAMQKAGFAIHDTLLTALRRLPIVASRSQEIGRLSRKFGSPPPTGLHLAASRPKIAPRLKPGDDQARFSVDLDVVNQILRQLWQATTIPQVIGQDDLDTLQIRLADLKDLCVGIPAAAQKFSGLTLLTPPVLSPGRSAPTAVHVSIGFRLDIQNFPNAALTGLLDIELPLLFQDFAAILWLSQDAADKVQTTLTVSPSSSVAPKSTDAKNGLSTIFQRAVSTLVTDLPNKVDFPPPLISEFTNADGSKDRVMATQIDAVTRPGGVGGYLTAGFSITFQQGHSAQNLISEPRPAQGSNVRVAIDDSFLTDVLKHAISAGEIDKLISSEMGQGITVTVHSGSVLFDAGITRLIFDATAHNACFFKDLDMTLTVTATVAVTNGTVLFQSPSVDIDLDDIDAVICAVNGIFGGGIPIVLYAIALPLLKYLIPGISDQSVSVPAPILIPGSEMDVSVALNSGTTDVSGNLILNALASVTADPTHYFIYLRIVSGPVSRFALPVAGATVELLELENPAPTGDDVHPEKLHPSPGHKIDYHPSNDQHLGTQVTDANGIVRFAVIPSVIAGVAFEFKMVEDPQTGKLIKVVTGRQDVFEAHPDFGINVTGADRSVMAKRLLVALNVGSHDIRDKHVGTFGHAFVVNVWQSVVHT